MIQEEEKHMAKEHYLQRTLAFKGQLGENFTLDKMDESRMGRAKWVQGVSRK